MKPFAALLLAVAAASPAAAGTLTGWFEGTVIAAEVTYPIPPRPVDDYLGTRATGSFRFTFDDEIASRQPFDEMVPLPGPMQLTVTMLDTTFSYPLTGDGGFDGGLWTVASDGGSLELRSDFRPRFHGFILGLTSDDASLRDGATPADLRLDDTTVSGMSLYFASNVAHGYFDLDITRLRLGSVAAPVPEPSTALLFAGGLAGLAWRRHRKEAP